MRSTLVKGIAMELEFQTKMTVNILYDYMLQHTYNSPAGILGSGVGGVFVVAFFGTQKDRKSVV